MEEIKMEHTEEKMMEVTKDLVYDLQDEINCIQDTDKDGLKKFNNIRVKLDTIDSYLKLMLKETNYDMFKGLNELVEQTQQQAVYSMCYYNGYQQALRDMKNK